MTTNRRRAESRNLTTEAYFIYARKHPHQSQRKYYYSWIKPAAFDFELHEVMCTECDYIPRTDCSEPKRAYRAHIKKHHSRKYWSEIAKPFVIKEEAEIEVRDWRKELLGV